MKIGIIGAGFVGLSAAYKLARAGNDVTVFERGIKPGGLAAGFRARNWEWPIEEHYHHWFISDKHIRNLARKIGHEVLFFRPKTSVIINNQIFQLDSPLSLLKFPHMSKFDRARVGAVLLYLKSTPYWKNLEKQTASKFLQRSMGKKAWQVLWEPLFEGKFGRHAKDIPASWFWARIKKRSASLGYPVGGFESFAESLAEKIADIGGKMIYSTEVSDIKKNHNLLEITLKSNDRYNFDKIICTLPTPLFLKITSSLPEKYKNSILPLKGLGAVTLILSLKYRYFDDGTYWLNINEKGYPFLAVVEHTNLVDKKYYNNEHLLYVGNYLDTKHKYFDYSDSQLIREFTPGLKRINKKFNSSWINDSFVFKAPFAQPIVPLNYSKQVPSIKTPIEGLYLANIQQVYPWDRGTNYAVELGEKVAKMIMNNNEEK